MSDDFRGAKLILMIGDQLLVLRRDQTPGIPWPGFLDFPGGGREGSESAMACALRETYEEVGLTIDPAALCWRNRRVGPKGTNWFFAVLLPEGSESGVRFGGEGEGWGLMTPDAFLSAPDVIPHFKDQLRLFLKAQKAKNRARG